MHPILFFFFYGYHGVFPYLLLIPYSIFVYLGAYTKIAKHKIEYYCDSFAIHLLRTNHDFEKLRDILKTLFANDKNRFDNISKSLDRKLDGKNTYGVAFLNVFPNQVVISFSIIFFLFGSIFFFEGSLSNLFLVPSIILVFGIIITAYYLIRQANQLIKVEAKLEGLKID